MLKHFSMSMFLPLIAILIFDRVNDIPNSSFVGSEMKVSGVPLTIHNPIQFVMKIHAKCILIKNFC
ncbi:hypothetical protein V6Z12_A02G193100 [Gossypium hirsutum]